MMSVLLENRDRLEKYLKESPSCLASFSFPGIFAWHDSCAYELSRTHGCLCVFARDTVGKYMCLPPLGGNVSSEVIEDCFETMNLVNGRNKVSRIENVPQEMVGFFDEKKFERYKKGYEYCYWRKDIVGLKGNAYKSQRWACNRFMRQYDFRYRPFSLEMIDACSELYDVWAQQSSQGQSDPVALGMIRENKGVHQLLMHYYQQVGLSGRVVEVNGLIKAYTFGFPISEKMFCVLLEITDQEINGLSAFLFREFCNDGMVRSYDFINVMDDIGLPHVGRHKMLYHPVLMIPSYVISEK